MEKNQDIKKVAWDVKCSSPPKVIRRCKRCDRNTEYISSGQFRINAQRKRLDIWLIYKCKHCNTTWNSAIYSHISPQQIGTELLERFHSNDEALAMQYAMNITLLKQNGADVTVADFEVVGEQVPMAEPVDLKISSQYPLPVKISSILKRQLGLSGREFENLISKGYIKSEPGLDMRKCRLSQPVTLRFCTQIED